jgi:hypothetical protein
VIEHVQEPQVIEMDTLRFTPTAVLVAAAGFGGIPATSFIASRSSWRTGHRAVRVCPPGGR